MIYYCVHCGAALWPGAKSCTACGKSFANAVPLDAETPASDVPGRGRGTIAEPYHTRWSLPAVCLAITAGVTALGWGGGALWMKGPGGEIAYQQHNLGGNAAFQRGDFDSADREYGQMIELRPHRVDGYLLRGLSENNGGQVVMAVKDNTEGLKYATLPTTRGDLFFNRALAWSGRNNWAKAAEDYTSAGQEYARESASEMLPYIPKRKEDVLRMRGCARCNGGQFPQAIADLTTVITQYNARAEDYGMRARSEAALKQDAAARSDFNRALAIDSRYMAGYEGLWNLSARQKQYDEAAGVLKRAIRVQPNSVYIWGNLAWFEYKAGHIPAAIEANHRAQSIDPNQAWINYNLALCYAVSGDRVRMTPAYAVALLSGAEKQRQDAMKDIREASHTSETLRMALAQLEKGKPGRAPNSPPVSARPYVPPAPAVAAEFAGRLAPDVSQNGYAVRPPSAYTLEQSPQTFVNGSTTTDLWTGPKRADETAPDLEIRIYTDDGRMAAESSSTQQLQKYLDRLTDNHSQFTASPITLRSFGGRNFVMANWSGIGQRTGKQFKGEVYVSVSPSEHIQIAVHDVAGYSDATLPLLRASVSTFRKL